MIKIKGQFFSRISLGRKEASPHHKDGELIKKCQKEKDDFH